jgi:MATE family multidrug resistance protein
MAFVSGRRTVVLALGFTLLCGLLFVAIPGPLARVFTPDPAVRRLAAELILVAAAVQIFDGLNIVSYGALKGTGDTAGPLGIVVVTNWGVGVPLVYLLTIRAGMGALGAWLGILVMLAGQGGWLYARFRAGRWKTLRVVEPVT